MLNVDITDTGTSSSPTLEGGGSTGGGGELDE